jgi:AcrR family transcriptional regulator
MKQRKVTRIRTRATTDLAKKERCAAVLSSAALLFASREFDDVSMAEIAKGAGLAKGTVYLYFKTKEALFLRLLSDEMRAWFDDTAARLTGPVSGPSELVRVITSTLIGRPVLPRLLGLLHPILERNVDGEILFLFKSGLLELTRRSAALFERVLSLPEGSGISLTLWMHALTVGLAQIAAPPAAVKGLVKAERSLAALEIDFSTELESALGALFSGVEVLRKAEKPSRKR